MGGSWGSPKVATRVCLWAKTVDMCVCVHVGRSVEIKGPPFRTSPQSINKRQPRGTLRTQNSFTVLSKARLTTCPGLCWAARLRAARGCFGQPFVSTWPNRRLGGSIPPPLSTSSKREPAPKSSCDRFFCRLFVVHDFKFQRCWAALVEELRFDSVRIQLMVLPA